VNETSWEKVDLVASDEQKGNMWIGGKRKHAVLRHATGQYVRGSVHINDTEGFSSLLKRGVSTFRVQAVPPLYLNEFAFRQNFRYC